MPKDEMQKMIVEGANRLFLQYGCKKVTMDQIAQELHVSKRTIYEIFEDKSALLDACLSSMLSRLSSPHCTPEDDDLSMLMMLAAVKVHAVAVNRHELMMRDLRQHYPEIYDRHIVKIRTAFVESLSEVMEDDRQRGRIRQDVDTEVAARSIVSMALDEHSPEMFGQLDYKESTRIRSEVIYTYMRGLMTDRLLLEFDSRNEELISIWRNKIDKQASMMYKFEDDCDTK